MTVHTQVHEQYDLSKELAIKLDLYDEDKFPKFNDIPHDVAQFVGKGALLLISPTVQTVPLLSSVAREPSLLEQYSNLEDEEGGTLLSIRTWGGRAFAKTLASNSVHDRGITRPYHVAIIPNGMDEKDKGLRLVGKKTADQFMNMPPSVNSMTIGQYLALCAIRKAHGLELPNGHTRLPHYPKNTAGFTRYIPVVSTSHNQTVHIQEFDQDLEAEHAGIRFVRDIDV